MPGCENWAAPIKKRRAEKKDEPPLPKWKKCPTCKGDCYITIPVRRGGFKRIQCAECRGYGRVGD